MKFRGSVDNWVELTALMAHTLTCGCSACQINMFYVAALYAAFIANRAITPDRADEFTTLQLASYAQRHLN